MKINSLRQMGGVNSIDNFARSFQRAANFREITPIRRGSITMGDAEDEDEDVTQETQGGPSVNKSLLRQQLEAHGGTPPDQVIQDEPENARQSETTPLLQPTVSRQTLRPHYPSGSLLAHAPTLGTSYGSISSRMTETARRRASILIHQQHEANMRALQQGDEELKDDTPPREVVRDVNEDGEVIERLVGESTVPMTVFNSTNVLVGVGILALPLGFRYSGWIIAFVFLTFAAIGTQYTAKILARCIDTNSASSTYGDIAFLAFGTTGRTMVEILFIVELLAANVALVIVFADSMNSLVPALNVTEWKFVITFGLMPMNFVSFKRLSITSVIGIFCCMGIILIVFADGLIKPDSPGSLRQPAKTYPFPEDWRTVPLSFGLFMAPWGGHSIFPAIYKDMRHPHKYPRAVRNSYILTYSLDMTLAVIGYLMFGDYVMDEISSNILRSKYYPKGLAIIAVILICIIPITKIPLSNRPMMDAFSGKLGVDLKQMLPKARQISEASFKHRMIRITIAVAINVLELGIAVALPAFDSVLSIMGSALCSTICIILPISFYFRIFGPQIQLKERIVGWILIVISAFFGTVGTIFTILPKATLGIE